MNEAESLKRLEVFARDQIAADRYPLDRHVFRTVTCSTCGAAGIRLEIEHHTGSRKNNFRGRVQGFCECGAKFLVLQFTGPHRLPERVERPRCAGCGHDHLLVAELERYESGLPGFFDEGVLAGRCTQCGHQQTLLFTD